MENGDEYIHSPFLPSDETTDKIGQFGNQNSFNNVSKFLQSDPQDSMVNIP